jgi:hypothetical protein
MHSSLSASLALSKSELELVKYYTINYRLLKLFPLCFYLQTSQITSYLL